MLAQNLSKADIAIRRIKKLTISRKSRLTESPYVEDDNRNPLATSLAEYEVLQNLADLGDC
jgi:hypothetical protein